MHAVTIQCFFISRVWELPYLNIGITKPFIMFILNLELFYDFKRKFYDIYIFVRNKFHKGESYNFIGLIPIMPNFDTIVLRVFLVFLFNSLLHIIFQAICVYLKLRLLYFCLDLPDSWIPHLIVINILYNWIPNFIIAFNNLLVFHFLFSIFRFLGVTRTFCFKYFRFVLLTLSWRRPLSYRNQVSMW